ncbi:DUF4105 domain-containing protein [Vibrio profundum]|uniref:Lnb N-terminal periplasmic domain-containing protein n=1 Tax=Vibrio profundum TaxID=2910247 RepID=UPI003D0D85BD
MTLSKAYLYLLTATTILCPAAATASESLNSTELAQDPYWLKLGHYLNKPMRGMKSNVTSKAFFLAEDGRDNPLAELKATITALYSDDPTYANEMRCQFPARYSWLEEKQGRSAKLDCPELQRWEKVLDPKGMTLVFPTAYMNNPSSMFGHTLLRIDAKDQTRHKELVAFAINFAAEPDSDDNPAMFALKGLIGSYPGRFTVMPYYRKVREYNDMESRDIWEYKLNFTEQEVNRVLLHLWELQHAEFDYYFLDENCSYQLLALLELARENLSLVDDFPLHAIPSDTVGTLANNQLLQKPNYRPAFGTRLLHQSNELDPALFSAARETKTDNIALEESLTEEPLTEEKKAAILEFAYEWLNFELYEGGLERDPTAKRLTQLLYQRSRLATPSPFSPVPEPSISPDQGHGSARFGASYLGSKEFDERASIEWRVAYHDLLDSQSGFIPGAKISFFDTQLSTNSDGNARLDKFYFIDAMALAPNNRTFDSFAWNIRTGFDRKPNVNKQAGRWFAQGGSGKAWGNSADVHFYALISSELSGGQATDYDAVIGLGVESGILWQASEQHRLGLQGQYLALFDSDADQDASVTASWNWSLNKRWALRTQASYQHWQSEDLSGKLTAYFYY